MNKKVITKINGQISESKRYKALSSRPYLCGGELCLGLEEPDCENRIISENAKKIKLLFNNAFATICAKPNGKNAVEELFFRLNEVKDPKELVDIFYLFLQAYELYSDELEMPVTKVKMARFIKNLDDDTNLLLSVFVKKLTGLYFFNLVQDKDASEIYYIDSIKEYDEVFNILNAALSEKSKMNGMLRLSKLTLNDVVNSRFDYINTHLCWENCANSSPLKCAKMGNEAFNSIIDFDFITDGYQVFSASGKSEKFYVTGCKNYIKTEPRVIDNSLRKKGIQFMYETYFDAESIPEALNKQDELVRHGKLVRRTRHNGGENMMRRKYDK